MEGLAGWKSEDGIDGAASGLGMIGGSWEMKACFCTCVCSSSY